MKIYKIVLELNPTTQIQFARTHYEEVILLPGNVKVSERVFANRGMANKYLRFLRDEYEPLNLIVDPSYKEPKAKNHPIYKKYLEKRDTP